MTSHSVRGTGRRPAPLSDTPSVEGGARRSDTAPGPNRPDLAVLFTMPDLGMSGVVGGRRLDAISLDREARVSGSSAYAPVDRGTARPHTVALSDGTRITFSSADGLVESA
ncbi:MAG: hypothetical protein P4L71_11185 [Acetobacteraceae bacterium]|nr:hypothetical protein [Acetobacteraceae bacterium]